MSLRSWTRADLSMKEPMVILEDRAVDRKCLATLLKSAVDSLLFNRVIGERRAVRLKVSATPR